MSEYKNLKYKIKYFKLKNKIKEQSGGNNIIAIAYFNSEHIKEFKINGFVKFIEKEDKFEIQIKF
jgi:hypothetical protein